MSEREEFWRAEAAYWRGQAERAQARIDAMLHEGRGETGYEQPPEPPVGTTFDTRYGRIERRDDGWHCDEDCEQCPVTWAFVWEWEVSPYARERIARRNGLRELPPADRWVP